MSYCDELPANTSIAKNESPLNFSESHRSIVVKGQTTILDRLSNQSNGNLNYENDNRKQLASTAIASALAMTLMVSAGQGIGEAGMEKCQGVVKAGMNDCGTSTHSCVLARLQPMAGRKSGIYVEGTCAKLVGGKVK